MKPFISCMFISLVFFSCGTSHRIVSSPKTVSLPHNQYKIQVMGENLHGKPTQDLDSMVKKRAEEVCKNYKMVSVESEITPDRKYTIKTWVIECPDEKSSEEQKRTTLIRPKADWRYWNGLDMVVKSYAVVRKCRGNGKEAAEGTKLVYVWIAVRNVSGNIVKLPSFTVELEGLKESSKSFGGKVCRYDEEALGNACWKWYGELYPGVMCEGWELFEVPEKMQIEGRHVKISLYSYGMGVYDLGSWRLGN